MLPHFNYSIIGYLGNMTLLKFFMKCDNFKNPVHRNFGLLSINYIVYWTCICLSSVLIIHFNKKNSNIFQGIYEFFRRISTLKFSFPLYITYVNELIILCVWYNTYNLIYTFLKRDYSVVVCVCIV